MYSRPNRQCELALVRVLEADTNNIIELIKLAGLDPKFAFVDGDWRNCDFRNLDLRGFCFNGANLSGANFKGAMADQFTSWQGVKLSDDTFEGICWVTSHSILPFLRPAKSANSKEAKNNGSVLLKAAAFDGDFGVTPSTSDEAITISWWPEFSTEAGTVKLGQRQNIEPGVASLCVDATSDVVGLSIGDREYFFGSVPFYGGIREVIDLSPSQFSVFLFKWKSANNPIEIGLIMKSDYA